MASSVLKPTTQHLFYDQFTSVNAPLNLISCFACLGFFIAYSKTQRKPIPLKMILLLVIGNGILSLARLTAPYLVRNETGCQVMFDITMFLFNFCLLWACWMSVMTARAMHLGFQAMSQKFIKSSLPLSASITLILLTMPKWIPSEFNIVYEANNQTCSISLSNPAGHVTGKIMFFFYGIFSGAVLPVITFICLAIVLIRLQSLKKSFFSMNFYVNISRLIWYPIAQMLISGTTLAANVLSVYFEKENSKLLYAQETMISLGAFIICFVYAFQRLLIYNEEKKLDNMDALSLSISEKVEGKQMFKDYETLLEDLSDLDY